MFGRRAFDRFKRSALDFDGGTIVECMGPKRRDSVHVVINQNRVYFGQIIFHKSGWQVLLRLSSAFFLIVALLDNQIRSILYLFIIYSNCLRFFNRIWLQIEHVIVLFFIIVEVLLLLFLLHHLDVGSAH